MDVSPHSTFDYLVTIAAGPGPYAVAGASGSLVGATPTLEVGAARPLVDRLPRGVELAGLPVCELTLRAAGPDDAAVEWASFVLPEALVAMFAPGDELRLVRPSLADVALRLRRAGRLLVAAGAVTGDDVDPTLRVEPGDDLRLSIDGGPAEDSGFVVSAPGPRPRSPLGRAGCVAISLRDACDAQLAAAAALLLHHGPFRTLPWVRRRRR